MNEILKAIFDRVNDQTNYDCFDEVPQNFDKYPFIKIQMVDYSPFDLDAGADFNLTIQITTYSKYKGSKEILDISQNIYNALHRWAMPDTASYCVTNIKQVFNTIMAEPKHRIDTQRYLINYETRV